MKDECYLVARRHRLAVAVVANTWVPVPERRGVQFVQVGEAFDAADDWIAARAGPGDVVVTDDILLAARCVQAGALALSSRGRTFAETSIGEALAAREAAQTMREMGVVGGGPKPFGDRDRSRFLQALEELVRKALRGT